MASSPFRHSAPYPGRRRPGADRMTSVPDPL
jgi:hypothetical protein